MAKTPRKPVKQKAKPARAASASGNRKLSPRKAVKSAKGAKKAPAKKAAPKKAAAAKKPVKKASPKKAAPKKAAPKKAAPKKAAPKKAAKPVKAAKQAPAKKAAPAKKVPAPVARKVAPKPAKAEAPAKPVAPVKAPKPEAPPKEAKAAKVGRPPKAVKPPLPQPVADVPSEDTAELMPDLDGEIPDDLNLEALLGDPDAAPILRPGALSAVPGAPKKRGRKRRDPLDDLLKPEKKKRGRPGRPRKRGGLGELMPKRPSRLKRRKGRRSEDDDADIPVAPRPPAPRDSMPLEQIRADVIARYLLGETPACPVGCGGMAQVVRVSTGENGAGEVWLECLSCAQRERFEVPAPGTEERNKVYATLDAGNEPQCTRHNGRYVPLRRRGRDLVCPECGILIPGR